MVRTTDVSSDDFRLISAEFIAAAATYQVGGDGGDTVHHRVGERAVELDPFLEPFAVCLSALEHLGLDVVPWKEAMSSHVETDGCSKRTTKGGE